MVEVVDSCSSFLFALVFSWNGYAVSIAMMVVVSRVALIVVIALHDVAFSFHAFYETERSHPKM
jgi:hypothetical protein